MDLWQLNIFCKVIELKSFSKAGKAVHLSQPTISSHIKDLEEHFGCRLIDRLSKEAVPTKAGELLYRYARRILALRDDTETALAEFMGQIKGHLVIGGSTIPGTYMLPQIIGTFKQQFPDVIISLIIEDTEKIIAKILDGILELGIVGAKSESKKISQAKLVEDDMRLIIPANHDWISKKSVSLTMLLTEPFIARERGSGTLKSLQHSLTSQGLSIEDLKIVAELGSTQAVCQGIKTGIGVSILSTLAVSEDLKAGNLMALDVEGLNLKRNIYLTWHKYRIPSPLNQAFVEFIKEQLQTD